MANSQGYPESRNRRMTARPPYPCLLTIPSHSSVTNHQNLSASRAGGDASSFYFHPHSQSHSHMIQPCILDRIWPSPCRRWHHPSACTTAASRSITHSRSHSHMIQPYNHAHPGFGPLCVCHQWHHPSACTTAASRSINEMTHHTPAQARWLSHMLCTGMPLTSISALPPESVTGKLQGNWTSYDSILDGEGRRSLTEYGDRCSSSDSLFDQTGDRSSVSSESVFGYDELRHSQGSLLPSNQFRPLSAYSDTTRHTPHNENDAMISVRFFSTFDLVEF